MHIRVRRDTDIPKTFFTHAAKKGVSEKSIYKENHILSIQMPIMISVLFPFDPCTDDHICCTVTIL